MPLGAFLDHCLASHCGQLQRDYVETFDLTRKCCLYLTYFTYGDTRRRGVALVQFKQAYRGAGVEFDRRDELPDHLAWCSSSAPARRGRRVARCSPTTAPGIEMLRTGSAETAARPGPTVVVALRATLPELDGEDRTAVAAPRRRRARRRRRSGSTAVRHRPPTEPPPDLETESVALGPTIPVGAP